MPKYVIHLSDGAQQRRSIDVSNDLEAAETALAAMSLHIARKFPPPSNIEIVVMNERLVELATLRFSYEVADRASSLRIVQ